MNIAFAGFRHSHIRALYAQALENPSVRIAGCWEEQDKARSEAQTALGADFRYATYAQMLSDPSVDAVAIGERYGMRGPMAIAALRSGKHVLSDKPLLTDMADLEEIERLCAETGKKVGLMLDLRYLPAVPAVRRLLASGEMGDVRSIFFGGQHPLLYGSRPGWYFEDGMHGGTINDIAIHGIDLVAHLTGKRLASIDCAREWNAFAVQEPAFLDSAQFLARLEGGCRLIGDVSYSAPDCGYSLPLYWRFTIWCEGGVIEFCAKDAGYRIAKNGDAGEKFVPCDKTPGDPLSDFLSDIGGEPRGLSTREALLSTKDALRLQAAARK